MSTVTVEPRVLLCEHCHEPIERDPRRFIFVVASKSGALRLPDPQLPGITEEDVRAVNFLCDMAGAPFTCSFQRADFVVGDDELAFGSMVCIKKWLLDWVNTAGKAFKKAGRA
jgi:hypothetical protein